MQYMGGKVRIAKPILAGIHTFLEASPGGTYYEPFLGGANIGAWVAHPRRVLGDANVAVVSMWAGARDGYVFPSVVSEADYLAARALPDTDPLKAFVLVGCSFGGKYGKGYARATTRAGGGYAAAAQRNARKQGAALAGAELRAGKYADTVPLGDLRPGDVIYCDPPYQGTTGYMACGGFNHAVFYDWCVEAAARGAAVLVSEARTPPKPHAVLWSKAVKCQMRDARGVLAPRGEYLSRILGR